MMRVLLVCVVALVTVFPVFAEDAATKTTVDYQAQIAAVEEETQLQVAALAAQANEANSAEREQIGRQVADLKQQGEIRRLEILLEWAQAEGDQQKIADVEQALNQWRNPPQTKQLPQVPRDSAPGSATDTKSNSY